MNKGYAINDCLYKEDIRRFRDENSLSRRELATILNVSVKTIEKWEKSDNEINGPIVFLLALLNRNPDLIEKYRLPEKKYPLRMYYMENNFVNTVIDVDIMNRKVSFKNYTDRLILRAFGAKEVVTYEDFEAFLESRCFPRDRDKMKIELEALGLRNYDPLAIIRKTEGKMAEDDCRLVIE